VGRQLLAALGATLNLGLLAPAWWLGGGAGAGPFLAAITLACWLEASAERPELRVGGSHLLPAAAGATLLALFWTGLATAQPGWGAWPGAALVVAGGAMRRAAIGRLGGRFTDPVALTPDHRLVTSGVYRWMRHPSELGTLCLACGAVLSLGSPVALAPLAALIALVGVRVRQEDRLLAGRFGDRWSRWASHTAAFWPRAAW
jgi:protein-S-isoprenylcysteine O-methyltransferase Ste14